MEDGRGEIGEVETFGRVKCHPCFKAVARHFNCFLNIWQHKDSIHSEKNNSTSTKDFYVDSITPRDMESKESGSTDTRLVKKINGTELKRQN